MAAGGFVGTLLRYGIFVGIKKTYHEYFDLATLIANYVGCFFAGLVIPIETKEQWQKYLMTLFSVGFCGSLTTFSGYTSYSLSSLENHHVLSGLGEVLFSLLGCFLFLFLGYLLTTTIKNHLTKNDQDQKEEKSDDASASEAHVEPSL